MIVFMRKRFFSDGRKRGIGLLRPLRTLSPHALLIAAVVCAPATLIAAEKKYLLSQGDRFEVYVLDEEDLTTTVTVNEEGTVFLPLLGEVKVEGMTIGQAEDKITQLLKGPYLVNPKVSATMVNYREFFIGGAVKSPGWYEFKPGMTFQQAVDTAGGFSEFASKKRIFAHHENQSSEERKRVSGDYSVEPGDTLFVAESFF